ncbi:hypothetical protein TKK_0000479 [Trichogramma kaykai]
MAESNKKRKTWLHHIIYNRIGLEDSKSSEHINQIIKLMVKYDFGVNVRDELDRTPLLCLFDLFTWAKTKATPNKRLIRHARNMQKVRMRILLEGLEFIIQNKISTPVHIPTYIHAYLTNVKKCGIYLSSSTEKYLKNWLENLEPDSIDENELHLYFNITQEIEKAKSTKLDEHHSIFDFCRYGPRETLKIVEATNDLSFLKSVDFNNAFKESASLIGGRIAESIRTDLVTNVV